MRNIELPALRVFSGEGTQRRMNPGPSGKAVAGELSEIHTF